MFAGPLADVFIAAFVVGVGLLGLVAVGVGGWLVWQHVGIGRALASRPIGWD